MLIDDEMSERQTQEWLAAQNIANPGNVADVITLRGNLAAFNLLDEHCLTQWVKRLAQLGCDYLILDCLRPVLDALGLDENHEGGRFLVAWDALMTQAGIPDAMLLQHMGHADERARGDSRFQDWPDAIWRLVRENDEPTSTRYFSAYGRDVDMAEGRLAFDSATRHLRYVGGSRANAKVEAAVLAVVKLLAENHRAGEDGLSGKAIEVALALAHSRDVVRDAVKRELGAATPRIGVKPGAHGAHLHYLLHPCSRCGMPVTGGGPVHLLSCGGP